MTEGTEGQVWPPLVSSSDLFQPEAAEVGGVVHFDPTVTPELRLADVPHQIVFWHRDYAVGQTTSANELRRDLDPAALFASHVTPEIVTRSDGEALLDRTGPFDADVTIVVCTRNRPEQLARCLQALVGQTCRPAQVVVVDSASDNDRTRIVAQAAGVEFVRVDQPGLDIARNQGILAARGEIVLFTDDDVVLHPRWLERMLRAFADGCADAVTGLVLPATLETEAQRHFERQWSFGRGYERRDFGGDFVEQHSRSGVPAWEVGAGASMAFRRSCFERFGLFDERLDVGAAGCSGDSEYWHRILTRGGICRYEPGAIAFHYHRADEAGLRQQLKAYMRGHAASLLVQRERVPGLGDLWRLAVILPAWYGFLFFRRILGERSPRTAYLPAQVSGLIEGIGFYLRTPRPSQPLIPPAPTPPASIDGQALISIVVPAYNAQDTLGATLTSLRNQTHRNLEIIVVDDGSLDGTGRIALAHAAADPRVRLLQQPNGGVASARNTGLGVAAADYVAFVDADDLCAPERTSKMLVALEQGGDECGLAYSWSVLIDQSDLILSESHRPSHAGWVHDELCVINFVGNGSAALVRTSVARAVGGFAPELRAARAQGCEDLDFYLRVAERHRFAVVPEFLTGYRQSASNMSSDRMQMYRSFRLVEKRHGRRVPAARTALRQGRKIIIEWLTDLAFRDGARRTAWQLTARLALFSPRWAFNMVTSRQAYVPAKLLPETAELATDLRHPVRGQRFPIGVPVVTH